nr:mitogen-activated protein kinase kinase kinase 1-like [Ipomoea batatas]
MASTSSPVIAPLSTQQWSYDVFLSFRGPDIRRTFIDYLYDTLENKGIHTFKDDNRLENGDCISNSLLNAIRASKIFIPVFTKRYASSKWCLEELATMMECHEKFKNQIVVPIFMYVEPSDVLNQIASFEDSFKVLLKKFCYAHGCFKRSIKYWKKRKALGSGSYGKVYEGITDGGEFFAVKEVSLFEDQGRIHHLQQEISLLSQLKHENIVRYLGTYKDDSNLYVFLELASKGSLASLYRTYQLDDVKQIKDLEVKALDPKGQGFAIHWEQAWDLKCANILIDDNGSVKLADFGLAKVINLNDINSFKGTIFWMAPEVAKGERYGCSADIWSLGCTVLEMLTRKHPYHGFEFQAAMYKLIQNILPDIPEDLSEDAKDFIRICLQLNPSDRPTAADLLQLHHPFLRIPSDVPSTSSSRLAVRSHRLPTVLITTATDRPLAGLRDLLPRSRPMTPSSLSREGVLLQFDYLVYYEEKINREARTSDPSPTWTLGSSKKQLDVDQFFKTVSHCAEEQRLHSLLVFLQDFFR